MLVAAIWSSLHGGGSNLSSPLRALPWLPEELRKIGIDEPNTPRKSLLGQRE